MSGQESLDYSFKAGKNYSLIQNSRDGIYRSTPNGRYIDANPALVELLGYDSREELLTLYIPRDLYYKQSDRPGTKERDKIFITRFKKKDGSLIWAEVNSWVVDDGQGNTLYYEGIVRDITERKRIQIDDLTGLYNRIYFKEAMDKLNEDDTALPVSIILGDVNGLKLINDAFGHDKGDELLRKVANILVSCCRQQDIIARWGGDEFVILLPGVGSEEASKVIKRIKDSCRKSKDRLIKISIALGYVTREKPFEDLHTLLKNAEEWMYKHKLLESQKAKNSIISFLEDSLKERGYESEEHIRRVEKLSLCLGKEIGLGSRKLEELSLLARLHDIGMILIPESIFNKPGNLNNEDWRMIKKHPEVGCQIANSSPELSLIAPAILHHHEYWDGSGYPRGIEGDEIPLISRIIGIADAYDIMTRNRPYHKAYSQQEAVRELKSCAGKQFDPELARIFIASVVNGTSTKTG
ncbi:MAG TPA: HD domain-containing phosphohydrolase [Halanaerobiales bacterium]|nr:HD domain-containing phosphohydrolase [Halanaerobiales bacterium]